MSHVTAFLFENEIILVNLVNPNSIDIYQFIFFGLKTSHYEKIIYKTSHC